MHDTSKLKPITAWEEPSNNWLDVAAIDFRENLDTKESRQFEKLLDDGTIIRQSPKLHRYWWLTPQDETVIITISRRCLATRLWNNITGKKQASVWPLHKLHDRTSNIPTSQSQHHPEPAVASTPNTKPTEKTRKA